MSPAKNGDGNGGVERIDLADAEALARWAQRLATSTEELRKAIAAVGPEVERVKRYLFVSLVRRGKRGE